MAILKGIISKLNGSAGNLTFKQLRRSISASRVPRAGGPFQIEPKALFQRAKGRSNSASRGPGRAEGSVPEGRRAGPEDNRTEIISPANEQYKGRKSLAACSKGPEGVPEDNRTELI